jgi:hypothetical protein
MEQIFLCLIQFVKSEYYYGESEDAKEHEAWLFILLRVLSGTIDGILDWILDLLTTNTHNAEVYVITELQHHC